MLYKQNLLLLICIRATLDYLWSVEKPQHGLIDGRLPSTGFHPITLPCYILWIFSMLYKRANSKAVHLIIQSSLLGIVILLPLPSHELSWTLLQQCSLTFRAYVYPQPLFLRAGGGYPTLYIHEYLQTNDSMQSFLLDVHNPNAWVHFH